MHVKRVARDSLKRINLTDYGHKADVRLFPIATTLMLWDSNSRVSVILFQNDLRNIAAEIAANGTRGFEPSVPRERGASSMAWETPLPF
jgi:hypothetical protein